MANKLIVLLLFSIIALIAESYMFWIYIDNEMYFWASFYAVMMIFVSKVMGSIINKLKNL